MWYVVIDCKCPVKQKDGKYDQGTHIYSLCSMDFSRSAMHSVGTSVPTLGSRVQGGCAQIVETCVRRPGERLPTRT